MGNLTLNGSSSGQITIAPPAVAGTNTLTLPATTGTIATTASPTFSGVTTLTTVTSPSSTALTLQSAGLTTMTLATTGYVGIGTSSPNTQLSINGALNFTNTVSAPSVSAAIFSPASAQMAFVTNSSEAVRIDSSGNVGIGKTSITNKLDVQSTGTILGLYGVGATYQGFAVYNNYASSSNYGGIFYDARNENSAPVANFLADINTDGSSAWAWSTQPAGTRTDRRVERMRIDSSGNLLVGITSFPTTAGQTGSGISPTGQVYLAHAGTSFWTHMNFINSNGTVGSIATNASTTSFNTSSDYRLKENVTPMTTGLATISALKPVTYDWISDKSQGEGFIAHELQSVIPQAVTGEKDAVDKNGKPVYQGVDYSKIVVHLVAAIQELKTLVDAQAAEITALKSKVGA